MRISDWSSDVCSSDLGEWDFAASGMASEMTADGSAQPILAMQSSVSPLHGLSPWDVAAFIISAHSSLICDAVTAALDIAVADINPAMLGVGIERAAERGIATLVRRTEERRVGKEGVSTW